MKKFEVVYKREMGSLIGICYITARSKSAAVKEFNEIYRYRGAVFVHIFEVA